MIHAVMVISTQAKPRLLKFYSFQPPEKHQELVRSVFQLLSARPDGVSNFVEVDSIFGPVRANLGEQKWSTSIWPPYTLFLSLIALRMNSPCLISYKFLLKHWIDASRMYVSLILYLTSTSCTQFWMR